jgi:hypothetical protein
VAHHAATGDGERAAWKNDQQRKIVFIRYGEGDSKKNQLYPFDR